LNYIHEIQDRLVRAAQRAEFLLDTKSFGIQSDLARQWSNRVQEEERHAEVVEGPRSDPARGGDTAAGAASGDDRGARGGALDRAAVALDVLRGLHGELCGAQGWRPVVLAARGLDGQGAGPVLPDAARHIPVALCVQCARRVAARAALGA